MSNECRFPASKMQPEKKVKHSENFALIYLVINSATQKKKTVQHSRLAVINVSGTKSWQRKKTHSISCGSYKMWLMLTEIIQYE